MNRFKIWIIIIFSVFILILFAALLAPDTIQAEKRIMIDAPADLVCYHIHVQDSIQIRPPWLNADTLYFKAFKGRHEEIMLSRQNSSTEVKWAVTRQYAFPLNAFITVIPVKKRMETRIENRLDALKKQCEEDMKCIESYQIRNIRFPETQYAAVQSRMRFDQIENYFNEHFAILHEALQKQNTLVTGVPCGILFSAGTEGLADIAAAISFTGKKPEGFEIISLSLQAGYELDFTEPYDQIYKAYFALNALFKTENTEGPSKIIEAFIDQGLVKIIFFI